MTWLDNVSNERADLKLAIESIKEKINNSKNVETVADDHLPELNKIESELKKQFN